MEMTINRNKSNLLTVSVTEIPVMETSSWSTIRPITYYLCQPVCGPTLQPQENHILVDYKVLTKMNC